MALVNGRYAVVDIASGEVTEHDLPDGYVSPDARMFAHVDSILSGRRDALAIGSGLATTSFIPAACGGFVRLQGDAPSHERTCLLTGNIGAELKLSGFDLIVLERTAEEPGYLWVRDGMPEFVSSPDMKARDSWGRTDSIRADQGDRRIQVVCVGPWGDAGHPSSQLVMNYWGGEDKIGLAAEFGKRNVLAVAFRGMGEIELDDPEGHFAASKDLQTAHIASLGRSKGLASFSSVASESGFTGLRHRDVACFGCPFPCRTFYKLAEDPRAMTLGDEEPGYLVYDIPALERLVELGMSARDAVSALMRCARGGAEPMSVAASISSQGRPISLDSVSSAIDASTGIEPAGPPITGAFSGHLGDPERYMDCLALGLCPRYWSRVGFDVHQLSKALGSASAPVSDLLRNTR